MTVIDTDGGLAPGKAALRRPGAVAVRTWRFNWLGIAVALLAFALALTPSLLPRPGLFLGIIAGLSTGVGYGVGTFLSQALRWAGLPEPTPAAKHIAWRVLVIAGPLLALVALVAGGRWQGEVRDLVGEEASPAGQVLAAAVALVTVIAVIAASRSLRLGTRWVSRRLSRVLPPRVAQGLGFVLVVLALYWLAGGVLFQLFVGAADSTYAAANAQPPQGVSAPSSSLRSGGPQSLVPWAGIGRQGQSFVGTGPTTAQLSAFSGRPAKEPIRVYAGVDSGPDARSRAELAVRELERTGAFDRAVLVVAGATGTGWLEPQAVDSVEYLWNGDTAIATIQYSFLPSWISFLVDKQRAADAGRELFDAIYAAWAQRPPGHRPKLIVYGLSLGSFAAQSAFGSAGDIATRTDGALFVGTPDFAQPWGDVTRTRDAGSPQWQPVYRGGESVRFSSTIADLANPPGPWSSPRVLYVQHASDPVVWWSPDLMTRQPDWLVEPRGPDVSPQTRWYPVVTFLQVTVDQFFGVSVPAGHGHNYANTAVGSWLAVVPPPSWASPDTARLQTLIDAYPIE